MTTATTTTPYAEISYQTMSKIARRLTEQHDNFEAVNAYCKEVFGYPLSQVRKPQLALLLTSWDLLAETNWI